MKKTKWRQTLAVVREREREHNTSEIVFINHVKKIKKIKDKMDRLKISDKKMYGYLIFYSLSFL